MLTSAELLRPNSAEKLFTEMRISWIDSSFGARKITWWQAAEIIGLSDRSMRRWRQRYVEHGYDGLLDRRWGKPSPKRVPLAQAEEVLRLYQEKYADLNVRHFHEKLQEAHGIELRSEEHTSELQS